EVQPCSIHLDHGSQMVGGSGDTEYSTSVHALVSSPDGALPWLYTTLLLQNWHATAPCYGAACGVALVSGAAGTTPSCCIRLQVSKRIRVDVTFRPSNRSMTIPQTCIRRLVAGIPKNSP